MSVKGVGKGVEKCVRVWEKDRRVCGGVGKS